MAQQPDPMSDDMSIAQGLLNEAKDPRQRTSFTGIAPLTAFDGSDHMHSQPNAAADSHPEGRSRKALRTSNTWTSSSGDVLSDQDDVDDRTLFVQEYNRLAKKHGIRSIVPEDYEGFNDDLINSSAKHGSWFSRKILRKTSSSQSVKQKPERQLKHRRSISDLSLRMKAKKDKLKDKDLQELVRLCGLSLLYLPTEYAAGSLGLPTCFRATAQYLVQHAPSTRGVFRIPGSQQVVAALYNHYGSMDDEGQVVSGTVRCPTLPDHIRCDVHDVASAFKKFLSGLPGGIIGSLHLFSAFISIQTQLHGDPELTRTKQSKLRARLIALAIATLRSQYRRELICAVMGLLSMIGRAAEIAPREDDRGRPLPTSDLMGYGPLGIVFGPLLVGDLLEDYTMRIANPQGGLILLPISPPKSRKERHRKSRTGDEGIAFNTHIDKVKVANSVTEMLITHWRDVVRHMRNLSALKVVANTKSVAVRGPRQPMLRPSASESFALRKPPDWDQFKSPRRRQERSLSPTPAQRVTGGTELLRESASTYQQTDNLVVKKQRAKLRPMASQRLSGARSISILSPTVEENVTEEQSAADGDPAEGGSHSSTTPSSEAEAAVPSPDAMIQLKSDIYRASSSSGEAALPYGVIPLVTSPNILPVLDPMRKENRQPSPTWAKLPIEDIRTLQDTPDYSRQQLHFMSTPAFSRPTPSTKSRRMAKLSKDSPRSMKSPKSDNKSRAKLQKQAPSSADRGSSKSKEYSQEQQLGAEPHQFESADLGTEIKSYQEDLSNFQARWTQFHGDERRMAALDAEKAVLEARFAALESKGARLPRPRTRTRSSQEQPELTPGQLLEKMITPDAPNRNQVYPQGDSGTDFPQQVSLLRQIPIPAPQLPDITFSKASSGDTTLPHDGLPDSQRNAASKSPRRIGGSEPGLQPRAQSRSPRRVSRSLYDHPKRKKNVLELSKPNDPLARVSGEEDDASLAILAQALASQGSNNAKDSSPKQETTDVTSDQKEYGLHPRRENVGLGPLPIKISGQSQSPSVQGQDPKVWPSLNPKTRLSKAVSKNKSPSKDSPDRNRPSPFSGSKSSAHTSQPKDPDSPTKILHPRTPTEPSGSPSRISALVARFNTGEQTAPVDTQTGVKTPKKSPVKTPVKAVVGDGHDSAEMHKESLVAPYTTNPPSTSRSQKSPKPEKTPQSIRSIVGEGRPRTQSSPTRKETPKRILRESLHDRSPMRHVSHDPESKSAPSLSSPKKLNPFQVSLRPVRASEDGPLPNAQLKILTSERLAPRGDMASIDNGLVSSQQPSNTLERHSSRSSKTVSEAIQAIQRPTTEITSHSPDKDLKALNRVALKPVVETRAHIDAADLPAFDGPSGISNTGSQLPHPDQPPVAHHLHLSRPSSRDNKLAPGQGRTSADQLISPPPGRSSSVLYNQVRLLQRQLSEKAEEMQNLRQQLSARGHLDIGTLSEELRETKRELQSWRMRAEVAEKQVQILLKMPSRASSLKHAASKGAFEKTVTTATESKGNEPNVANKAKKAVHGMDGTESPQRMSSEDSTSTVIREFKETFADGEYGMWDELDNCAFRIAELGVQMQGDAEGA